MKISVKSMLSEMIEPNDSSWRGFVTMRDESFETLKILILRHNYSLQM
jgi:hypothetical protein